MQTKKIQVQYNPIYNLYICSRSPDHTEMHC